MKVFTAVYPWDFGTHIIIRLSCTYTLKFDDVLVVFAYIALGVQLELKV